MSNFIDWFINHVTAELIIFSALVAIVVAFVSLILTGRHAFLQKLTGRLGALDELIDARKRLLEDVGEKETLAARLKKEVEILEMRKEELNAIKEKHQKSVSEYEDAKENLRTTREEWSQLKDKIDIYKNRVAQIEQLENELQQLQERKVELEKAVEDLPEKKKQLEKLNSQITNKQQELEGMQKKQVEAEKKLLELLDDCQKVEKDVESQEAELKEVKEEIEKEKERLKELEQRSVEVTATIEANEEKLKSVGRLPKEAFESLYNKTFERIESAENQSEATVLNRVQERTRAAGFDIPLRLQRAFHTALKTSDISCLTVMAGVSGTGKSAFPKIYADTAGMNFSNLAVEPRWDSPQDLFGFLNYVENRFEATSLGRALVQFNNAPQHLRPDDSGELSDQMLLVLLDEMNLARIEYYFSEFLSKLETRRNVMPLQTKRDYRLVSTEVFGGYPEDEKNGREEMSAIHLYAGSNVLFVGTMNEDETTQSLSDKVIDRANVLHFGKPQRLSVTRGSNATHQFRPIAVANWKEWLADVEEFVDTNPEIGDEINNLNSILERLGRPFGFRTFRAMYAYVANHPDTNRTRALADQVAMRIMPKLRGLDVNEHSIVFNELSGVVNNLNDPALNRAFDQGKNNAMGWFDWKGIDWSA